MPITLDTFRAAIQSKNEKGFVELTNQNNQVGTYATGFFARTFGWYKKRSADTNLAVRQQFYELLSKPGKCQENVLAAIKDRLGLNDSGSGVKDRPLSIREVRTMMTWADNSTKINKFEMHASDAFSNMVLQQFQGTVGKQKELPDNTPYTQLWDQTAKDMERGLGLSINGQQISRSLDCGKYTSQIIDTKLKQVDDMFNTGNPNDKQAGKIIAGFAHQAIPHVFSRAKQFTGDTMKDFGSTAMSGIQFSIFECNVNRQDNGSYDLDFHVDLKFTKGTSSVDQQVVYFTGNSRLEYNAKLSLSFNENGVPSLTYRNDEKPHIKYAEEKCPYSVDEMTAMAYAAKKSLGREALTSLLNSPELMHSPELRTKMNELNSLTQAAKDKPNNQKVQANLARVREEISTLAQQYAVTAQDRQLLEDMGIDSKHFSLMCSDWGGSHRIDHQLMSQLKSTNNMERANGFATLQQMCQELHDMGFTDGVINLNPPNMG